MASKTAGKDAQNREVAILGSIGDENGGGIGEGNLIMIHFKLREMNRLAIVSN